MGDDAAKDFQLKLDLFGKRNRQTFHIMEDLTLACDLCKTPEAKKSILDLTRDYFRKLQAEQNSLNKDIETSLKDAAKKGKDDKSADKALEAAAKKAVEKFTSVNLGENKQLKLKFNGLKNPPYLIFEMKF